MVNYCKTFKHWSLGSMLKTFTTVSYICRTIATKATAYLHPCCAKAFILVNYATAVTLKAITLKVGTISQKYLQQQLTVVEYASKGSFGS